MTRQTSTKTRIAVHAGVGGDVQTTIAAYRQGGLPVVGLEGACQH